MPLFLNRQCDRTLGRRWRGRDRRGSHAEERFDAARQPGQHLGHCRRAARVELTQFPKDSLFELISGLPGGGGLARVKMPDYPTPRQFWLDTIDIFVLKAGFGRLWSLYLKNTLRVNHTNSKPAYHTNSPILGFSPSLYQK